VRDGGELALTLFVGLAAIGAVLMAHAAALLVTPAPLPW
jgi:hypothetical protein